jgi:hypothetical protein
MLRVFKLDFLDFQVFSTLDSPATRRSLSRPKITVDRLNSVCRISQLWAFADSVFQAESRWNPKVTKVGKHVPFRPVAIPVLYF